jgi:DNA repair exonuclease SbcCD ATPase subunit
MQTMAPPNGELEQRFARIEERVAEVDRRVVEAAKATDRRFEEVNWRITEFKQEANRSFDGLFTEMRALRQEMTSLHATVQRGNYTMLAAMLGLIAAILAKGG